MRRVTLLNCNVCSEEGATFASNMRFCELDEAALGMRLASWQLEQSRAENTAETKDQMALEILGNFKIKSSLVPIVTRRWTGLIDVCDANR